MKAEKPNRMTPTMVNRFLQAALGLLVMGCSSSERFSRWEAPADRFSSGGEAPRGDQFTVQTRCDGACGILFRSAVLHVLPKGPDDEFPVAIEFRDSAGAALRIARVDLARLRRGVPPLLILGRQSSDFELQTGADEILSVPVERAGYVLMWNDRILPSRFHVAIVVNAYMERFSALSFPPDLEPAKTVSEFRFDFELPLPALAPVLSGNF